MREKYVDIDIKLDELLAKYKVSKDKRGLKKIHRLYEENFKKLVNDSAYLPVEQDLQYMCELLQKKLGVYLNDPCPLHSIKDCSTCTGYFVKKTNKRCSRYIMADEGEKCSLFEYSENGTKGGKCIRTSWLG